MCLTNTAGVHLVMEQVLKYIVKRTLRATSSDPNFNPSVITTRGEVGNGVALVVPISVGPLCRVCMYCIPSIASVNLVMGCSKVFFPPF